MFGEQTFAQLRTGLKPYPSLPPSLISLMVSGDVKHHETGSGGDLASAKQLLYSATCSFASCAEQSHKDRATVRTTGCWTTRSKRPPNPLWELGAQVLCESRSGRPGFPVANSHYGLCGRKATLVLSYESSTSLSSYRPLALTGQTPPHRQTDVPLCGPTTVWDVSVPNSKHWFTTSFLQPLPYLVTP